MIYKAIDKEPNYFEILNLNSTQVTLEEVNSNYEILNKKYNPAFDPGNENLARFKQIQEAHECLKFPQCKQQYTKFGSYIQHLNQDDPAMQVDLRLGQSLVFYITYAILAASLSS